MPVPKPSLTSEDFAVYLEKIPGCYFWLGTRNEEKGMIHVLHNARFNLDESVLLLAVKLYLKICQRLVC